jgi:ligand-binding sensor domain-containing protein
MKTVYLTAFLALFVFSSCLFSQNPEWIVFDTYKSINAIVSDGNYFWIGTEDGLVKMNLITKEKTYFQSHSPGLPSYYTNSMVIDKGGNLWLSTSLGLTKYDGMKWDIDSNIKAGVLAIDQNGKLLVGTGSGLKIYNGTNWVTYDTTNSELPNNNVRLIAIDSIGNYWLGTDKGLAKFDGTNWTIYKTDNSGLPNNPINLLVADKSGDIWLGTDNGVVKYDGLNWTVFDTSNSDIPSNGIMSMSIDLLGYVWAGTSKGLAKFDGKSWSLFELGNYYGLPKLINTIYTDKQGNIWMGGSWGVLSKFDGLNLIDYNIPFSGLQSGVIENLVVDKKNNLWIGSHDLTSFNGSKWNYFKKLDSVTYVYPFFLALDSSGNIWTLISDGIAKFDGENWKKYDTRDFNFNNNLNKVAIDKYNNLWFIIGDSRLVKFNGNEWTVYDATNSGLPCHYFSSFGIDRKQNIWIVSECGLVKFNNGKWSIFNNNNSGIPSNSLNSVAIDLKDNIWIGCLNKLVKFDGDKNWTVYDTSNSIYLKGLYSPIACDKKGNMWFGADSGLIKFDGSNWKLFNNQNSTIKSNVTAIAFDNKDNTWIATVFFDLREGYYFIELHVFREGGVLLDSIYEKIALIASFTAIPQTGIVPLSVQFKEYSSGEPSSWYWEFGDDSLSTESNPIHVYRTSGTFTVSLTVSDGNNNDTKTRTDYIIVNKNTDVQESEVMIVNKTIFPNPFKYSTNISYSLPHSGILRIGIYDTQGQLVKMLYSGSIDAGEHTTTWDGRTDEGSEAQNGVYFYHIQSERQTISGKMVLIR